MTVTYGHVVGTVKFTVSLVPVVGGKVAFTVSFAGVAVIVGTTVSAGRSVVGIGVGVGEGVASPEGDVCVAVGTGVDADEGWAVIALVVAAAVVGARVGVGDAVSTRVGPAVFAVVGAFVLLTVVAVVLTDDPPVGAVVVLTTVSVGVGEVPFDASVAAPADNVDGTADASFAGVGVAAWAAPRHTPTTMKSRRTVRMHDLTANLREGKVGARKDAMLPGSS